jgi:hypothetical protein
VSDEKRPVIIHVSGIPATGKSLFCRYLAREHGFTHYDMECFPRGWPIPSLKSVWDASPQQFVREAGKQHGKVAIDWGFPVGCVDLVRELPEAGATLVWFTGEVDHARRLFIERGGLDPGSFDHQVQEIEKYGLPEVLDAKVINTLTSEGNIRPLMEIYAEIFS